MPIERHKTAIKRVDTSRPVRLALEAGLICPERTFLDYGCGHGFDLQAVEQLGIKAWGWDPVHRPKGSREKADVVNLGFVLNVIENPAERARTLRQAMDLSESLLIVSARLHAEIGPTQLTPYGDGFLTTRKTFQKFYDQAELRQWIDGVLEVSSVAAGPGIFYVFKNEQLQQSYLASTFRRTRATPKLLRSEQIFEDHKEVFTPLIDFLASHGRLPAASELTNFEELKAAAGSLKRAFSILQRVTGSQHWEEVKEARAQDLLVYIALSRFGKRPNLSALPKLLQLDVKAFFGSYVKACKLADNLLFSTGNMELIEAACQTAPVGLLTENALLVHRSALGELSPILRVYEGCGRGFIGDVEGANILKLRRDKPKISYMAYPDFDRKPHPAMTFQVVVDFRRYRSFTKLYDNHPNPLILHRKECFVGPNYPGREKFAKLTRQEDRWGLFERVLSEALPEFTST
jgi:DNA phosphorothioation-associated putative methyltransferase